MHFSFKARLSDTIAEKESTISRRESAVKSMTDELIKANDIIHKLQTDIRMLNQKVIYIQIKLPIDCEVSWLLFY